MNCAISSSSKLTVFIHLNWLCGEFSKFSKFLILALPFLIIKSKFTPEIFSFILIWYIPSVFFYPDIKKVKCSFMSQFPYSTLAYFYYQSKLYTKCLNYWFTLSLDLAREFIFSASPFWNTEYPCMRSMTKNPVEEKVLSYYIWPYIYSRVCINLTFTRINCKLLTATSCIIIDHV